MVNETLERQQNDKREPIYETIAYTYTNQEVLDLYRDNIRVKQVIAGQPITKGGSRCDINCDTDNHHLHTYCKVCKRNLMYGTIIHDCTVGIGIGKIHPVMDPAYLVNEPWWEILVENNFNEMHHYSEVINFKNQQLNSDFIQQPYEQVEVSQLH